MASEHNSANPPPPEFRPFIPPEARMQECTVRAIIMGSILGVLFGASSLYLVLKVGITVSASIPVAVISLTLFRMASKMGFRDATILENNIVQTAGSAGESIAFGIGVTMPAIMILGFNLEYTRVMLVALLGGLLGILMMIPLRRALIVQQHKELKYPEGAACAELLKAGADEESLAIAMKAGAKSSIRQSAPNASAIFAGFGVGLVYSTAMRAGRLWKDTVEKVFGAPFKAGSISSEISPELLGVGYVIGPRIASIMFGGGVLSYLVLIPMIKFFGEGMTTALAPGNSLIKDMGPDEIRGAYILYIGAGAVAAGGIISLLRSGGLILRGIRAGLADFGVAAANARAAMIRTDRDLSMKFVIGGSLALILAILLAPSLQMNLAGAILIVVFGFLFVTVSSRLTGEIGSSSNPISGMTVATLLLTCLIFLLVGWTGGRYYVTALSVGGIVCIAASNGGSTSQDLKTGYLLGSTPKFQQIAILIGAAASAVALGPILLTLNQNGTVYAPVKTEMHAPANAQFLGDEKITGPQAASDTRTFRVWQKEDEASGGFQKFLVDQNGNAVYRVDPGINGSEKQRPDGTSVQKFQAPKAVLMSYIIKGILDARLPWALVLFGVMISIVLELSGISSLAFAVGVYLPISSSAPVFIGGLIRWLVDKRLRHQLREHKLDEDQLMAETDKSPGVLLASGYIAGGAIAGIIIAILSGLSDNSAQKIAGLAGPSSVTNAAAPTVAHQISILFHEVAAWFASLDGRMSDWAEHFNPFYSGPHSDLLALIPFTVLVLFLYLVGSERLLKSRRQ